MLENYKYDSTCKSMTSDTCTRILVFFGARQEATLIICLIILQCGIKIFSEIILRGRQICLRSPPGTKNQHVYRLCLQLTEGAASGIIKLPRKQLEIWNS